MTNVRVRRACATAMCVLLAAALALCTPLQALAYFNKGSVEVTLGATELSLEAGKTASVTVTLDPASDEQLDGCGMAGCPQYCADGCLDDNGQCSCSGDEYATYYADAVASSSDSSVAIAVYDAGALTVYARGAGEATITVSASLRQYTDGQAAIEVVVTGEADADTATAAGDAATPEEAEVEAEQEDKADVVEKTVMMGTQRFVRITDTLDAAGELADFAGMEGDITFWYGDTYYQPDYSVGFAGDAYEADDVADFDPRLDVSTEASGTLATVLSGLDEYVIVEFSQTGALAASATVYAMSGGAISDGAEVALYSYDEDAKCFVAEDAEATVVNGYVTFEASEGKTYAVSTHDLTSEATAVVELGDNAGATVEGDDASGLPPVVGAVAAIVAIAVVLVAAGLLAGRRRARAKEARAKEAAGADVQAPGADAQAAGDEEGSHDED